MVQVNSTDKIETLIGYLQSQIDQHDLNPTIAKMFLYAMWISRSDNEVILQPKWTFAVPEFKKHLNFYKKYNLLHWNGSPTRFVPDEDLYQSIDVVIEIKDSDTIDAILEIGEEIPEFNAYYSEAIA